MKKYIILLLTSLTLLCSTAHCDEGMWIPSLISSRMKDMRSKGFKLSAEDIYSVNKASLKDAVVLFGGGCTGEIISNEGLLLTNHHCGYGEIQSHSTPENDLLTNGFWAMNRKEELPNTGLVVSFLVRMDDVTTLVLKGTTQDMPQNRRDSIIKNNSLSIKEEATKGTHHKASVDPFYYGNQYFLFIYEEFNDVRLVGAPPSSIGKFGGDTDNWMWPRHTGDFSLFRIYANKDNKPAPYCTDNIPYKPKRSLTISTKGISQGDFTFIYGNPGRTTQYITSDAVDYILNLSNPHKIALRTMRLDIMNDEQAKNVATRIAYASKNAGVANAWKKWQGESKGIARLKTIDKKRAHEAIFEQWAKGSQYETVLPELRALYAELSPFAFARDYYNESYGTIELLAFAGNKAIKSDDYKDYSAVIDRRIAKRMLAEYIKNIPACFIPQLLNDEVQKYGSVDNYVDYLFNTSAFSSADKLDQRTDNDPAIVLRNALGEMYSTKIHPKYTELNNSITTLYRTYMKGMMEMQPSRNFFPDANLTLRVAYGKVEGYKPFDATYYTPLSTLDGVIEKDNPNIYDYDIPQRMREIYATKDYGKWVTEGTVPVAFLATNHTTGGNSGSPVLNNRGELIGINFDRTWESTMSDIEFDPIKCRNIAVDIRYVLFVIDKIGNAGYLLNEMKLK